MMKSEYKEKAIYIHEWRVQKTGVITPSVRIMQNIWIVGNVNYLQTACKTFCSMNTIPAVERFVY